MASIMSLKWWKKVVILAVPVFLAVLIINDRSSIFNFGYRLFRRGAKSSSEKKGIEMHLDFLNLLRKPAVWLEEIDEKRFSKIGGLPDVPSNFEWPSWKDKPLSFLCQLDLSEIPKDYPGQDVLRSGYLYFFYDQEQSTWGYDPKDKGSWYLYYSNGLENINRSDPPEGLEKEFIYEEMFVNISTIYTYPYVQDDRVDGLNLSEEQEEEYMKLCASVFKDEPKHQLFGDPFPIQDDDMDLECQLVFHGIYYGGGVDWNDPRVKELKEGKNEWILLLQLDSDKDSEMMWGDEGMLYFLIRKEDLKRKNFDNTWMVLQCY